MILNVTLIGTNQTSEQYLIESGSWSNCVSYCEGLNKQIMSISKQSPTTIIPVVNVSGITNCFIITELPVTNIPIQHYVWDNDFTSVANWVVAQEITNIRNITNQQITYSIIE